MGLILHDYIYKKFSKNINFKGGRNRTGKITLAHRVQNVNLTVNF